MTLLVVMHRVRFMLLCLPAGPAICALKGSVSIKVLGCVATALHRVPEGHKMCVAVTPPQDVEGVGSARWMLSIFY